jgi:hypothetical protein
MGKASRRKVANQRAGFRQAAIQRVQGLGIRTNVVGPSDNQKAGKISQALVSMMEDEIPDDAPLEEYRSCLDFVVIAWNLSLVGPQQMADAIGKIVAGFNRDAIQEFTQLIQHLIDKKLLIFPNDRRFIVSHEVFEENNSFRISAAALSPDSQSKPDPSMQA